MPRNFLDMMNNTRTLLGDPRAQTPNDAQLLQQGGYQIRNLLRAKRNVGLAWNYGETVVEITPGEATYQITDASLGTPLSVSTVPQTPNDVIRLIPFSCPQNLDYSWGWPVNAGNWAIPYDGSNCNAARCAIFWQNNLPYIQFNPIPQLSPAAYLIKFLANANLVGIQALTATPLPDEDCDLVELRMALGLLAVTEWMSPETADGRTQNAEKRKNLSLTLSGNERLAAQQFDISNRIIVGPRLSQRWSTCTE